MKRIAEGYRKHRNFIERILFPVLLVLYPLLNIGWGVEVTDTTYSLANFEFFSTMDGTWTVATFLANVTGSIMMKLPFGNTLKGMYLYTSLVQSAAALGTYEILRRRIRAPLVLVGEWIAAGLCWCPSACLYNYMTYLFMTAGILLLYEGILREDRKYYAAAGVCLGLNVAVRMPNVVQAAFIAALWYDAAARRRPLRKTVQDTLCCAAGYAVGFGIPFAAICIRYGAGAYVSMVQTLFAMTDNAVDYKPTAMLTSMFGDYAVGLFWMAFACVCMAGGRILFAVRNKIFAQERRTKAVCLLIYLGVLLVLLRFYWGKGVFSFRYYDYSSIYYPAVLLLLVIVFAAVCCLFRKTVRREQKVLALLVLVQILITPLGSNNYLYPIINDLFIAAPFVLWTAYESSRRTGSPGEGAKVSDAASGGGPFAVVWRVPFVLLTAFVLIQSIGFHMVFSFRDGDKGEPREKILTKPVKAAGICTNPDNAAQLEELAEYAEDTGLIGREAVLYGNIPGLSYLLDMPSALSTFWPDLDSYLQSEFERDMAQITDCPVIIAASPVAAYLDGDADGMERFGTDAEKLGRDGKLQMLADYMDGHSYRRTFANDRYTVYVTEQ